MSVVRFHFCSLMTYPFELLFPKEVTITLVTSHRLLCLTSDNNTWLQRASTYNNPLASGTVVM